MTKEKECFIRIICDHLNNNKTLVPDGLDWKVLKKYAKQQQMEGIIYFQTKNSDFLSAFSSTVYFASNRDVLLKKLLKEINSPCFIIKGTEVAKQYPIPALRTMGDIDIVVKDRNNVHKILISQGYKCISKNEDREWQYHKMNMEFELHDRLVYTEAVNVDKQELFFNDFWKYVKNGQLDWNFHFMFLVFHLRKHFMNSGVGFRQFMDLAVVIKNQELDWNFIEEKLEEIELISFFKVVLAFLERWFQVDSPIEVARLDERFYEEATEKIFKDGIFGFDNDDNKDALAINTGRRRFGRLKNLLVNIFPTYQILKSIPQYSFINGRPYLLPIAWIYRVYRGRKKIDLGVKTVKDSFVSKEKMEKREQMYKQWGL